MLSEEGFIKIEKKNSKGVLVLGHGFISHIVKIQYLFKNLLLYSQAWIRQTNYYTPCKQSLGGI